MSFPSNRQFAIMASPKTYIKAIRNAENLSNVAPSPPKPTPRTAANPRPNHHNTKPTKNTPPRVLDMSPETCKLIIVGRVHCQMDFEDISHALGYRPHSNRYYTQNEVKDAFEHLKHCCWTDYYRVWGPSWRTYQGQNRVSQHVMEVKKALLWELLWEGERRATYARWIASIKAKEQARRRSACDRINLLRGKR